MSTEIIGNLGSDTFDVSGDVSGLIVSDDLQGLSGLISHTATSGDSGYDGIPIEDVVVRAAQDDVPQVVITQSDGYTEVDEGGKTDTYSIRLASRPDEDVYITVSAPLSQLGASAAVTGAGVTLSSNGSAAARALVLIFTPDNWKTEQTVTIAAIDDAVAEEHGEIEISHSIISADANYNGAAVPNLRLLVRDNDAGGLFVDQTDGETIAVEGGVADTYDVSLTHEPDADVVVTLTLDQGDAGQVVLTDVNGDPLATDGVIFQ